MKHSIPMLALAALVVLSVDSYAGNQTNAAGVANVTAVVICEIDDQTLVDEISVELAGNVCPGGLTPTDLAKLHCNKGSSCMRCLGELKIAGLTVSRANAYIDTAADEELAYHLLEGNAGPFVNRTGICPD